MEEKTHITKKTLSPFGYKVERLHDGEMVCIFNLNERNHNSCPFFYAEVKYKSLLFIKFVIFNHDYLNDREKECYPQRFLSVQNCVLLSHGIKTFGNAIKVEFKNPLSTIEELKRLFPMIFQ